MYVVVKSMSSRNVSFGNNLYVIVFMSNAPSQYECEPVLRPYIIFSAPGSIVPHKNVYSHII